MVGCTSSQTTTQRWCCWRSCDQIIAKRSIFKNDPPDCLLKSKWFCKCKKKKKKNPEILPVPPKPRHACVSPGDASPRPTCALHSASVRLHQWLQSRRGAIESFPTKRWKIPHLTGRRPLSSHSQVSRRGNFTRTGTALHARWTRGPTEPWRSPPPSTPHPWTISMFFPSVHRVFIFALQVGELRAVVPWCSEPPGWPCSPDSCPPARGRWGFHTVPPGQTSGMLIKKKKARWDTIHSKRCELRSMYFLLTMRNVLSWSWKCCFQQ